MKNDLLGYRKEIRRGVNKSQLIFSLSLLVQFSFFLVFNGNSC